MLPPNHAHQAVSLHLVALLVHTNNMTLLVNGVELFLASLAAMAREHSVDTREDTGSGTAARYRENDAPCLWEPVCSHAIRFLRPTTRVCCCLGFVVIFIA